MTEQRYLSLSLTATLLLSGFGVTMGLVSGSIAIAFDAVYALIDAAMTLLALIVSRLIHQTTRPGAAGERLVKRFNMGLWHLEPLVVALNGCLLMAITLYGFVNAVTSVAAGGTDTEFGPALIYTGGAVILCATVLLAGRHQANRLDSDLIRLDIKGWTMSGTITSALFVAFLIGFLLDGTAHAWVLPYVDPVVLAVVSLAVAPRPVGIVYQAFREVLMVTPPELRQLVDRVATETVAKQGFLDYRAYVAEVGRAEQIDLYFIVPPGHPARPIEDWDELRDEIGEAIGAEDPNRWLTITFTADPEWAE